MDTYDNQTQSGFYYTVNITVGTPPQSVVAIIDSGSSNLILNSPNTQWCQDGNCTTFGAYNASASTSSKWVDDLMNVTYAYNNLEGSWVLDDVHFGGQTLSQFPIGTANVSSNSVSNIWGVGYLVGVVEGVPANDTTLQAMVNSGLIKSASMSVYLNQTGSKTGSIIFGGLDTSLYTGDLHILPIVPEDDIYARVAVNLTSVSLTNLENSTSTVSNTTVTVVLDTGTADLKVPTEIAQYVQEAFNVTLNITVDGLNYALCDCSLVNSSGSVTFGFGSAQIDVPMNSLVASPPALAFEEFGVNPSLLPEGFCLFLVNALSEELATNGLAYLLGDPFLANAYMVFDQDANEVGIAQANFKPGKSNILEISSGTNGLNSTLYSNGTTPSAGSAESNRVQPWWTLASMTIAALLFSI